MPQTNALFTSAALGDWLRQSVTDAQAVVVEVVVWGWLAPILRLTTRPDTLTADQYAAALELAGIAYSNPEGLSEYQLESEKSVYSSERRDEILRILAAQSGTVAVGLTPPSPTGSFPAPKCYPDPADRRERAGVWWT